LTYEWDLGTSTKNQDKVYGLLQALLSINAARVRSLIVISDFSIIIIIMNNKKTSSDNKLSFHIVRIKKETLWSKEVIFFQVQRACNQQESILANEASKLGEGILKKNEGISFQAIP
jgi:hypothetical protein